MLRIEDLHVQVGDRTILQGVNLHIRPGETHVLFGPNGSGKSTLLGAILGFSRYKITRGKIYFKDEDITHLSVHERAERGIGIAFQRPPVLRGVTLRDLLRISGQGNVVNIEELAEPLNLVDFLGRDVNYGFSGGETKRSEMLQLLVQNPDLVLLDEPESGVDLENIALIGQAINRLLQKDGLLGEERSRREMKEARKKAGLIITHTGYILDYVPADVGHVLYEGKLSCSGLNPRELLGCIHKLGYGECTRCLA
ncbi:MAG TPA: ABC transporter ATP-binding protein [Syntrophomonadaceae bacterium]|nr:ABC transporter ATP-binding protein [Syntrophomonadaceae bacterium]